MSRVISQEEHDFLGFVFSWASKWSAEGVSNARYRAVELLHASVELSLRQMTPDERKDTIRDYQRLAENLDCHLSIVCDEFVVEE